MSVSDTLAKSMQLETRSFQPVSFPVQIFFKSSKIVPVMLVGLLLNQNYSAVAFAEALGISIFTTAFTLSARSPTQAQLESSPYGVFLVAIYTLCDAFTWQWQYRLHHEYKVDIHTVMLWSNVCHLVLVLVMLVINFELFDSLLFILLNPSCVFPILLLSVSSAVSQLTIFYAVHRFGPPTFTIMMSSRQMISMTLSSLFCGLSKLHPALFAYFGFSGCPQLHYTLGKVPIMSALAAFTIMFHKARRAPHLPVEIRSDHIEVN